MAAEDLLTSHIEGRSWPNGSGTFSPWPLSLVDRADSLLLNVGE